MFVSIFTIYNPIEEFWSMVKAEVRRTPLRADDNLTDRIHESVMRVKKSDCEGWIRQSLSFFDRCLNEERNLNFENQKKTHTHTIRGTVVK
jgi:hypothetical protein